MPKYSIQEIEGAVTPYPPSKIRGVCTNRTTQRSVAEESVKSFLGLLYFCQRYWGVIPEKFQEPIEEMREDLKIMFKQIELQDDDQLVLKADPKGRSYSAKEIERLPPKYIEIHPTRHEYIQPEKQYDETNVRTFLAALFHMRSYWIEIPEPLINASKEEQHQVMKLLFPKIEIKENDQIVP